MTGELAQRARSGNLDAWRAVAKATGRELIDDGGMLTYFSMAATRNFNPTIVYEPLADPAAALTARAAEYERRGVPFGFEIPEGLDPAAERAATARGMSVHIEQPAMVLHPIVALPDPDPRVRIIGPDELDLHLQTQAAGFNDPIDALRVFSSPQMFDACTMLLAFDEGAPAATSIACVTGGEAGVFGVTTRPEHRRRGLGRAATVEAVRIGAQAGADLAYLHASEMGRPVYERIGFRTVERIRIYVD
ncbi:MAG TPA: GNAT family N-acetyltransferase [Actinomycetota bacterium]